MKLATTRHAVWLDALPPAADIMERGAFVQYVVRPDEPLEILHYQVPEMVPVHPQGQGLAVLEELCAGHLASQDRRAAACDSSTRH